MKCQYCGVTTEKTTGLCDHCGAPLSDCAAPEYRIGEVKIKLADATKSWRDFVAALYDSGGTSITAKGRDD